MRILRTKIIRKYLLMYRLTFGIDSPYNVSFLNIYFYYIIIISTFNLIYNILFILLN